MNKETISSFFKGVGKTVKKRSPEILTGIGIAGMITSTVLAVKATPKALELIDEEKEKRKDSMYNEETDEHYDSPMKTIDYVKVAWKPYIPAVVTGAASIGCLVGASTVSARRNAALLGAYQLSTTAFHEYRDKVVETFGEKKEKTVHDAIAKDKIEKNPPNQSQVIVTKKGNTLFYDELSDRYFKSDIDRIKRAMNDLNYRMTGGMEMYISLNDFYDAIDLARIPIGNQIGWTVGKGMIDVYFSAQLTEDEEPCIVLGHLVPPEHGFDKLY